MEDSDTDLEIVLDVWEDNDLESAIDVWERGDDIPLDLEVRLLEKGYNTQALRAYLMKRWREDLTTD